jgi:hypothetical protein
VRRITRTYNVDLRCPCCAVVPVMKVYENTTVSVLFCGSCERAWTMDPANVPRGQRALRPARAHRASPCRSGELFDDRRERETASITEHTDATPLDAVTIAECQEQSGGASIQRQGSKISAVHRVIAAISRLFGGRRRSGFTWIRQLR